MVMFNAFNECGQYYATLPIIKSAEENAFLLRLMEKHGHTWLGMLASEGDNVFEWLDGTSVADTFSAWAPDEPNNVGAEKCGIMYVTGSARGKWSSDGCAAPRYTVCQMEKEWATETVG